MISVLSEAREKLKRALKISPCNKKLFWVVAFDKLRSKRMHITDERQNGFFFLRNVLKSFWGSDDSLLTSINLLCFSNQTTHKLFSHKIFLPINVHFLKYITKSHQHNFPCHVVSIKLIFFARISIILLNTSFNEITAFLIYLYLLFMYSFNKFYSPIYFVAISKGRHINEMGKKGKKKFNIKKVHT